MVLIKISLSETNIKSISDHHYDNSEFNNYENIPYNYFDYLTPFTNPLT